MMVQSLALINDIAVPFQSEDFQGINDLPISAATYPWSIDVIDPQQPFAAVMAGVKIARQRRNDGPEVERAAGSWGKTSDISIIYCIHKPVLTWMDRIYRMSVIGDRFINLSPDISTD